MMIETINTYESKPSPERGRIVEKHRKIYRCTKCTKVFTRKEEAEIHKHKQLGEGDK
jgi:hypothetical protein